MKRILIIILLISTFKVTHSQNRWTYQECVNYAVEHNLRLENNRYDIESQRLRFRSAKGGLTPSINANAGYDINSGKTVDPNTNAIVEREFFSNSYGISGNLVLFNGFRQMNYVAFEKYNLMVTTETMERAKNTLAYNVLEAYTIYLNQQGLTAIQQEQVEISSRELYRIQKNIELGLASGSELYEAEARLLKDEFELIRLQNQQRKAEFDLKALMNLPSDSLLLIEEVSIDDEVDVRLISGDSLYNSAIVKLPRIKSLNFQLEAAKRGVNMAKGNLTPSLVLYGRINTGYYETSINELGEVVPFRTQIDNNMRIGYGLALQIPLFDGFQRRVNVQRYTIERERAKNDLKIGLQDLEYDIDHALMSLYGAEAEYVSAMKNEESMGMAFRVTERKRDKGMIGMMEYFEAKYNLARASSEVLRTRLQLFLQERSINFYLTGSFIE